MFSYKDIFGDKQKVLVVTAHPDDADVFFGGSMTLLCQDKKEVFVLVMTNGCRGSRENRISEKELARVRLAEQTNALAVYGIPSDHFATLNFKDGEAQNSMELIGKIAYYIRKFRPDIVCTHNPNSYFSKSFIQNHYHINHKDHRVCGISTADAVYPFSRDRNFFPAHSKEGLLPHSVRALLFTGVSEQLNTEIDISEVLEKKKDGMRKHKSQFDGTTVERILGHFKKGGRYMETGFYITLW